MRDLTIAEYRTALALLARPYATERERIRASGLPTSTYNVVHRRLFEEGWLVDLLLPNPGPCGFRAVELRLTRPAIGERTDLLRRGTSDPECVLLWSGVHATFAIYFRAKETAGKTPLARAEPPTNEFRLLVSAEAGSVPVYFDYGGLWSRFGHEPPPSSYPQGLDAKSQVAGPRSVAEAGHLFRPETSAPSELGPPGSTTMMARNHPRLIEDGLVQVRTALRQARVPPLDGRRIGEVIFVVGRLRRPPGAAQLLNDLTGECGVYPFLFTESGGRVLLAGLGQTSAEGPRRVLVSSAARPVMSTLNAHLDHAEVMIEPVEAIEEIVDHRYGMPNPPARLDTGK